MSSGNVQKIIAWNGYEGSVSKVVAPICENALNSCVKKLLKILA